SEQLVFQSEDAGLVRALIGDAVLTESADAAVHFVQSHPGSTAVSLDGTVARPEGVISGGSGDDVAAAMVEQKREMHQLADQIAQLSSEYEQKNDAHNQCRSRLSALETSLDQARQAAHEGALAHVGCQKDLAETQKDLERVERRQSAIEEEVATVLAALDAAALSEAECSHELEEVRGRR